VGSNPATPTERGGEQASLLSGRAREGSEAAKPPNTPTFCRTYDRRVSPSGSSRRTLGDFIRDNRQLLNLSLRDLASMTNVSNAYLSQVERGLHQPSIRVLRAIADALELSSEQMMTYAGLTKSADTATTRDDDKVDTEAAIMRDRRLSADDRQTLLALYRRLAGRVDAT
jgi:transcriptional regulator with XRE-family HTH domain